MKQDDELWMKKMKEMLQDYNEPAPPDGWERLSQSLMPPVQHKIIPRKWWGVAAAVLILAVSGVSFYFLHTPVAEDIRLTDVPVIEITPDAIPVIPQPEAIAERIKPAKEIKSGQYIVRAVEKNNFVDKEDVSNIPDKPVISDEPSDSNKQENEDVSKEQTKTNVDESRTKNVANNNGKEKSGKRPFTPVVSQKTARNNWTVGLSVNSGTASLLNNDRNTPLNIDKTTPLSSIDLSSTANNGTGFIDLSDKDIIFTKDGGPEIPEYVDIDHHMPVTVGLSLRKEIGNGFSVETGLSYTFLKSDITKNTEQEGKIKGEQKLHYIGIPVRANWDFIDNKNFNVYLSAGGMVEKCVYGKTLDENNTVKPLQLSLNAGVGAQYNLSKQVGIYVEPGVSYFFDDGSKVETIRKENPFNFNLQAGVRFTY